MTQSTISEASARPMPGAPSEAMIATMVRDAVRRETLDNLEAGRKLHRGAWIDGAGYAALRRKTRRHDLLHALEALVFWAIIAALGWLILVISVLLL